MHTRRMEVISFHDMITHALLFNPATGRLYDPTDRATIAAYRHHDPRIWDGQGGFSEEQLANTMTIANYAQKNAPVGTSLAVPPGPLRRVLMVLQRRDVHGVQPTAASTGAPPAARWPSRTALPSSRSPSSASSRAARSRSTT